MAGLLDGKRFVLMEGRQADELARLLEAEGATAIRCPMIEIRDASNPAPVVAWLRQLAAGRFDWIILLTGEGLRRLMGFAERADLRQDVIDALAKTSSLTRGPKPVRALKEIGLAPTRVAEFPTTEGVIATLGREELRGKIVGVQLYGEPNPALVDYLEGVGATVHVVQPYEYAQGTDPTRVADVIDRIARGEVAGVIFTSSPQVEEWYKVIEKKGLQDSWATGLDKVSVAAVGPLVADAILSHGGRVDLCPAQGFVMKNLVKQIKESFRGT